MKKETKELLAKAAKELGWGIAKLFGEKVVETANAARMVVKKENFQCVKDHPLGDSSTESGKAAGHKTSENDYAMGGITTAQDSRHLQGLGMI